VTLLDAETRSAKRTGGYDLILAGLTLGVSAFGVIMVYSATKAALISEGFSPYYFLKRQTLFVIIGAVIMLAVSKFDYRRFEQLATPIYLLCILALLAVKSPLGSAALGSQRWFSFGIIQIQPSEFAVLGMILAIATYCGRRPDGLTMRDVRRLLLMAGIPIALVFLQPDLGTSIIMVVVLIVMLAIAGVPPRFLLLLGVLAAGAAVLAVVLGVLQHYQVVRLTSFLNQNSTNPAAAQYIYQVHQAKAAIGAGGLFGQGLSHGLQTNLDYVPEQHTDFIFTAVGEQLGFVGAAGLLAALGVLAARMLRVSMLAKDQLGQLIAVGIFTFFAFSCFQNVGMIMGIMQVTGIPLPFMSYGGSAAVCFFISVGMVLSVSNRKAT